MSNLSEVAVAPDPSLIPSVLIGGFVVLTFMCAIMIWVLAAFRDYRDAQLRRNVMIGRSLNHVGQGVVMVDGLRCIVFINDTYLNIYGIDRFDVPPRMSYGALLELRRRNGTLDLSDREFYERAGSPGGFISVLPDGRSIKVKYNSLPNGGAIATHDDVTAQRALSRELADTKRFLETVLDNVPVALAVKDARDGRYLFVNRLAETIIRYKRDDVIGRTPMQFMPKNLAETILQRDAAAIRQRGIVTADTALETATGLRLFQTRYVTLLDPAGEPQYLIKTESDVHDSREAEARMAFMAYHDPLTDLPNRAAFLHTLSQMIEACKGSADCFAVLSVDLNGLKEVNDVFGHAIGDSLLIEVARRIEEQAGGNRWRGSAATNSA